jgi:hypothetical protein
MSAQEKDELMRTVQAQVALANMQELLSVTKIILENGKKIMQKMVVIFSSSFHRKVMKIW